jgi:DNA-binding Xre family transcriptional regulator
MAKTKDSVKEFLQQVGDNIRVHRIKRGMSLEALGNDIGLDKSSMHRIESGKNITLVTLAKIAAMLEINPSQLLRNVDQVVEEDAEKYIRKKT